MVSKCCFYRFLAVLCQRERNFFNSFISFISYFVIYVCNMIYRINELKVFRQIVKITFSKMSQLSH